MTAADDFHLITLQQGEMTVQGEFLWGSNYTFLVQVEHEGTQLAAVYKPSRGERPLWDFPTASLAHREVAAYLVSEASGWQLVPATVHRKDGPAGAGSLQVFIDHDPEYHYFNFSAEDRQRLRRVALFDLLINNADRKGSHILIDPDDHLWLIDHGAALYFHHDWADYLARSRSPFPHIKDHTLLTFADSLPQVDVTLRAKLTPEIIRHIVNLIPEPWLDHEPDFASQAEHRQAYVDYLLNRLAASPIFLEEALRARTKLV